MFGFEKVGFLTLTFEENVVDHKEAYRRFNSFRVNFLTKYFDEYMLVKERQKRGAWHYHLLVAMSQDIRTGFDFDQVFPKKGKRPCYLSVSPYLRNLWKELRESTPKYGMGRPELAPIRTNDQAMAKYVGKYIEQNVVGKKVSGYEEQDKGVRLISYSRTWPRTNTKFSWNSEGAKEWRRKLQRFTTEFLGFKNTDELKDEYGPRWAYLFTDYIVEIDQILEDSMNLELRKAQIEKSRITNLKGNNVKTYDEIEKMVFEVNTIKDEIICCPDCGSNQFESELGFCLTCAQKSEQKEKCPF